MSQHLMILGRQPELSLAELSLQFGEQNVHRISDSTALVKRDEFNIQKFGGVVKAGHVIIKLAGSSWKHIESELIEHYVDKWSALDRKQTVGISVYDFTVKKQDANGFLMNLKRTLKKQNVSLRTIESSGGALNTAVSHHNKLGLSENKTELLVAKAHNGEIIIAESTGAQNITALKNRDQARPKTDAFVGMLPPKLALMMLNMTGINDWTNKRVLDPFCGTGVVLQEAALLGASIYGTDLSEKMIRYTRDNINWLEESQHASYDWFLHEGDATETKWTAPIDAVVCETYLGQPFSAPPKPEKRAQVMRVCQTITTKFIENVSPQIKPGTPLVIAVPAWRDTTGALHHLKLGSALDRAKLIFRGSSKRLIYARDDQVVVRELLLLEKK